MSDNKECIYREKKGDLILGTAQLGMDYGIANRSGKPSRDSARKVLMTAYENGVRCFDTARGYGASEGVIGDFVKMPGVNAAEVKVISKFQRIDGGSYESVSLQIEKELKDSLKELGRRHIDIYMAHSAGDIENNDLIKKLSELKEDGRIKHIGVSVYHPSEAEKVVDIDEIEYIEIPFNVFDTRFVKDDLLGRLCSHNKTILARSIYLQGLFFVEDPGVLGKIPGASMYLRELRGRAGSMKMDLDEFALRFVRSFDRIHGFILGAETTGQVLRNVRLMGLEPFEKDLRDETMSMFTGIPEEIVLPYLWNK